MTGVLWVWNMLGSSRLREFVAQNGYLHAPLVVNDTDVLHITSHLDCDSMIRWDFKECRCFSSRIRGLQRCLHSWAVAHWCCGWPAGRPVHPAVLMREIPRLCIFSLCIMAAIKEMPLIPALPVGAELARPGWVSLEKTSRRSICLTCRAKNRRDVCTGAIFGGLFFFFLICWT